MFESKYHKLFLAAFCIANLTWSSIALPSNLTKAATAPKSVPQSQGPPDPCEQALTPPGNANGLHKRCDAAGLGGGTAKGDFITATDLQISPLVCRLKTRTASTRLAA